MTATKFRIIVRRVGKTDNSLFTVISLNPKLDSTKLLMHIKDYLEAEMEHDLAEGRQPQLVVVK